MKTFATWVEVAFAAVNPFVLSNWSKLFHLSSYKFLVELRRAGETDLAALAEKPRLVRLFVIYSIRELCKYSVLGELALSVDDKADLVSLELLFLLLLERFGNHVLAGQ